MGNPYPRIKAKNEKSLPKPVLEYSRPLFLLKKADTHPASFCKQPQSQLVLSGDKNTLMWSKGHLTALSPVNLRICLPSGPWDLLGVPWKGEAFSDLHWTRLEINLLVNLSHSMWNNRTGGDVTFLVGEHIKGACRWGSPWTPKGISGCQLSLGSTGGGRQSKAAWATHWILHTEGRRFLPLLIQLYALHYAWLFNIQVEKRRAG